MPLSVKTKEHFRRRFALAGPKWGALAIGAAALAGVIGFTASALHFVTVTDTHGGSNRILTVNQDTAAVLAQAGVAPLGKNDKAVTSETPDGMLLQVLRAYTVQITADGQTQELITTGATTAELLAQAGLTYTDQDILSPGADETVTEGEDVILQRVSYVEYTEDETIPSEIQEIPTSLFYRKQDKVDVVQQGADGLDTVTYRETWVDGQWAETEEIDRATQIGMVPTIQKVYGEQAPVSHFVGPDVADGAPVEGVAAVYSGQRATGYSAGAAAKGASGRRLTYGTVAINPSVIPYGSLLYITSDDGKFVYGYAYAADTGTALQTGSAFIDLYYETYDESVDNAVISVTVYVLDDETAARYKEQNDAILEADTVVGQ